MVCLAQVFPQAFKPEDTYHATRFPAKTRYWFQQHECKQDKGQTVFGISI